MSSNFSRILSATVTLTAICSLALQPCYAGGKQEYMEETRLGLAALESDNLVEAEKHLQAASDLARLSKAPKYGEYTKSLLNLGMLYEKKKDTDKAETQYREALKNYIAAFGEKSLEASVANEYLGDLYRKSGKFEQAIKCYEKTKEVREVAAPNHPDLADTLAGLAQCKAKTANKDQAIPLMQKVISIRETAYGKTSGKVLKSRIMLAQLYEEIGKAKLAIPAYEGVIEVLGATDKGTAIAYERLAGLYETTGRPTKVDACYKAALKAREAHVAKDPAGLSGCVKQYASYLRSINKPDDAKALEAKYAAKKAK